MERMEQSNIDNQNNVLVFENAEYSDPNFLRPNRNNKLQGIQRRNCVFYIIILAFIVGVCTVLVVFWMELNRFKDTHTYLFKLLANESGQIDVNNWIHDVHKKHNSLSEFCEMKLQVKNITNELLDMRTQNQELIRTMNWLMANNLTGAQDKQGKQDQSLPTGLTFIMDKLKSQIQEDIHGMHELKIKNQNLTSNLNKITVLNQNVMTALNEVNVHNKNVTTGFSNKMEELSAQNGKLVTELDGLKVQNQGLHASADRLKVRIDGLVTEVNELKVEREQLVNDMGGLKEQSQNIITGLDRLNVRSHDFVTEVSGLKVQNENLTSKVETHTKNLSDIKLQLQHLNDIVNISSADIDKQLILLQKDILFLKTENENTTLTFQEQRRNLEDLANKITNCNGKQVTERVSFTAYAIWSRPYSAGDTVIFDRSLRNYGDGYNASTGIFTCSISGLYLFYVNLYGWESFRVEIYIDSEQRLSEATTSSKIENGSTMSVAFCSAGSKVWVKSKIKHNNIIGETHRSSVFTGTLLYTTDSIN